MWTGSPFCATVTGAVDEIENAAAAAVALEVNLPSDSPTYALNANWTVVSPVAPLGHVSVQR